MNIHKQIQPVNLDHYDKFISSIKTEIIFELSFRNFYCLFCCMMYGSKHKFFTSKSSIFHQKKLRTILTKRYSLIVIAFSI